jgi:hypothetical protein
VVLWDAPAGSPFDQLPLALLVDGAVAGHRLDEPEGAVAGVEDEQVRQQPVRLDGDAELVQQLLLETPRNLARGAATSRPIRRLLHRGTTGWPVLLTEGLNFALQDDPTVLNFACGSEPVLLAELPNANRRNPELPRSLNGLEDSVATPGRQPLNPLKSLALRDRLSDQWQPLLDSNASCGPLGSLAEWA